MFEFSQPFWQVISQSMTARSVFVVELFVAEMMFMAPFKRRPYFPLRAGVSLIAYFGVGFLFPEILFPLGSCVTFLIFALSLGLNRFCFDYSFKQVVFQCSFAYGLQGLVTDFSIGTRALFSVPSSSRLLVDAVWCTAVYIVGYLVLARRCRRAEELNMHTVKVMILCLTVTFAADVMSKLASTQSADANLICRASQALATILALCFQYSSFRVGKLETEKEKMEALIKAEQEQYRVSRETIDLVNMKCHDLKYRLSEIRSGLNGAGNDALKEMEDAVLFYEKVAKTGNDALDSVLTEKSLYCERYAIQLTYIADGKKMGFIAPSDIYSLIGNAIDNAIECVMKEQDEEKRIIFLNVSGKGDMLSIHMENYCAVPPVFEDGLPVTTKEDRQNHGIGVRSIRYLAGKYGGNAVFGAEDSLFTLDVMIPVREGGIEKNGCRR